MNDLVVQHRGMNALALLVERPFKSPCTQTPCAKLAVVWNANIISKGQCRDDARSCNQHDAFYQTICHSHIGRLYSA